MYNQLKHYLKEQSLLYKLQSGFKMGHPSLLVFVLLFLWPIIIWSEMDFDNYTGMMMIDLQKTFDTVDNSIF